MKFLARLEFDPKWRHLFFKNFGTLFRFHLYGIEKICANFDALVIIWTIIYLKSPTIADSAFIIRCKIIYCKILETRLRGLRNHNGKFFFVFAKKISENTSNNILNCYFSNQIYTLTHQTKYLCIKEIKLTSRKQYLFDRLCSVKAKTTHKDQSIFQVKRLRDLQK